MEHWFQRACAREPDERYPSALALVEALRLAAGISSPAAGAEAGPFHGGDEPPRATPADRVGDAVNPLAGPGVARSTTAGTSLRTNPEGARRNRQLLIVSSAIGLAVGVLGVAFALRLERGSGSGTLPAASAHVGVAGEPAATPSRARSIAAAPALSLLEPATVNQPIAVPAQGQDASSSSLETVTTASRPRAPSPSVPAANATKPSVGSSAHSTSSTKPAGTIDLGY